MESTIALTSCTAGGIRPECVMQRESLQEELSYDLISSWVSHTFQALFPWSILLFVIQVSDVKAVYKNIIRKFSNTKLIVWILIVICTKPTNVLYIAMAEYK